jgi:2-amino-4-hydroxy-6-hydroxymethyldihydropteridine diphosphokinase
LDGGPDKENQIKKIVYLSLGSNIGDRYSFIHRAVENLRGLSGVELIRMSDIYETEPVGYTNQDKFLNAVVCIKTTMEPFELLAAIQKIEKILFRVRETRWGPRTIDIDILLFDDLELDKETLQIPHPRMFERAFVLIPFKDVYAGGKYDLEILIERCDDKNSVILWGAFSDG